MAHPSRERFRKILDNLRRLHRPVYNDARFLISHGLSLPRPPESGGKGDRERRRLWRQSITEKADANFEAIVAREERREAAWVRTLNRAWSPESE